MDTNLWTSNRRTLIPQYPDQIVLDQPTSPEFDAILAKPDDLVPADHHTTSISVPVTGIQVKTVAAIVVDVKLLNQDRVNGCNGSPIRAEG